MYQGVRVKITVKELLQQRRARQAASGATVSEKLLISAVSSPFTFYFLAKPVPLVLLPANPVSLLDEPCLKRGVAGLKQALCCTRWSMCLSDTFSPHRAALRSTQGKFLPCKSSKR